MTRFVSGPLLAAAALAAIAATGCRDALSPPGRSARTTPSLHFAGDQPVRMTGGGRIDAPPGTADKNPPNRKQFQTFGFHVGDKDRDGRPEGQLEFTDHTPEHRIDGHPLKLKAVGWRAYRRTDDDCLDAGIEAEGTLEAKHSGERYDFRLYACDNGEPGTKPPHDALRLEVFSAPGVTRWSWQGLLTGGNLQAHFDEAPGTGPTTGELVVRAATAGTDSDPDGYAVTVDGSAQRRVATNGSVTFGELAAGDHQVLLGDVAANCTVGGANPRRVTVPAGGTASTTFDLSCTGPGGPGAVRITGRGTIGAGNAAPGSDRQEFDFDVASTLTGRFFYRDWGTVRPDGTTATLTVNPGADPATGIRRFRDGSAACTDFTRGAEFDASARLDNGDLVGLTVVACDLGPAGSGADYFGAEVRFYSYARAGSLASGDIVKMGGGTPRASGVRVTGLGQLGAGAPLPGNDVQTFQFDVSADLVGAKFYTDWGIIRPDGTVGTLRVDPADLATGLTAFRDGSAACAEPARGVEFEGIGRVNTGGDSNPGASELLAFTVRTCDTGAAGALPDYYELLLFFPDFTLRYEKRGALTAGDVVKVRT